MRQLLHALIVAVVAATLLASGAWAASLFEGDDHIPGTLDIRDVIGTRAIKGERPVPAETPASDSEQRSALFARVIKPFGAVVRALPSNESAIVFNSRCGDTWQALAVEGGWVKIRAENAIGWIGGSRVHVSSVPPTVDCSEARHVYPTGYFWIYVPTGCLNLRSRPSFEAASLACVETGHTYAVLDGPFDPGSGDDWFRVTSPTTGTGWVLAAHLFPS